MQKSRFNIDFYVVVCYHIKKRGITSRKKRRYIDMDWISTWNLTANKSGQDISPMHIHDRCELLFLTDGQAKMQIVDTDYELCAHRLVIIAPLEPHDLIPTDYPYSRIGFHIDVGAMERIGVLPMLSSPLTDRPEGWVHIFDLTPYPDIEQTILELHEEYVSENAMKSYMLSTLIRLLLLRLHRSFPERFAPMHTDSEMEHARQHIEKDFASIESITTLASSYYITPSHFIVRFKKHTGCTPHNYLNKCRIAHARQLLTDSNLTLSCVAEKCGFSDLNGFVRSFRKATNVTPGEFRRLSTTLDIKM